MLDRKLIGILGIALIASTTGFSFFVGEKVRGPIEIIKNEWNLPMDPGGMYQLPRTEGRYAYALGLVLRTPVQRLDLVFGTLENSSFETHFLSNQGNLSQQKLFRTISEVGNMTSIIESYAVASSMPLLDRQFPIHVETQENDGFLVDLTYAASSLAPSEIQRTLPTLHAILLNSNGRVSQYYRGFPDFFLEREKSILDITIQYNQNITKYSQRMTQKGTSLLMKDAPGTGHLVFNDLKKEDQILLTIAINPSPVSTRKPIMHVVLIFIDGQYYEGLANLLKR